MIQNTSKIAILTVDRDKEQETQDLDDFEYQFLNKVEVFDLQKMNHKELDSKTIRHFESDAQPDSRTQSFLSCDIRSLVLKLSKKEDFIDFSVSSQQLALFITYKNHFFLTDLKGEKPQLIRQMIEHGPEKSWFWVHMKVLP